MSTDRLHVRTPLRGVLCAVLFAIVPAGPIASAVDAPSTDWPQFRGPSASGVAQGAATATTWDVASGKNVKWKSPVPGLGFSCPVIWGDRLFVTTALKQGEEQKVQLRVGLYGDIHSVQESDPMLFKVLCFDKNSGKQLWEQTAHTGVPTIKRHPKSSHANPTPATDGKHLVAFFGSEGLYCYDLDGKLLWKKDLGVLDAGFYAVKDAQWGFASSPVIHDGKVIVQCDVQNDPFLAVFDLRDGAEVWRTPRRDYPTWSTPTIHTSAGKTQVLCNGFNEIAGYDFATGQRVWRLRGGGDIPVPTPVVAHGLVFITSAHGFNSPLFAVKTSAEGEITPKQGDTSSEFLPWFRLRGGNYMQTPLVLGDLLYCCKDNGVLTCLDARSGKEHYSQRIEGGVGFTASPVSDGRHLYFTSEDGQVHVLQPGPAYKHIATNPLGEISMATPALSNGVLFFRTQGHVIAIAD
jgi:outer membrane protein assembly factor BamB